MDNDEVSLQDLIYVLIRGWKVILLSTLFSLFLVLIYLNLPMSEESIYETNASMVINSKIYAIIDGGVKNRPIYYIFRKG